MYNLKFPNIDSNNASMAMYSKVNTITACSPVNHYNKEENYIKVWNFNLRLHCLESTGRFIAPTLYHLVTLWHWKLSAYSQIFLVNKRDYCIKCVQLKNNFLISRLGFLKTNLGLPWVNRFLNFPISNQVPYMVNGWLIRRASWPGKNSDLGVAGSDARNNGDLPL